MEKESWEQELAAEKFELEEERDLDQCFFLPQYGV